MNERAGSHEEPARCGLKELLPPENLADRRKACRVVEALWREKNVPPQVGMLIISKLQPFVEDGGKLIVFLNFPHKQGKHIISREIFGGKKMIY